MSTALFAKLGAGQCEINKPENNSKKQEREEESWASILHNNVSMAIGPRIPYSTISKGGSNPRKRPSNAVSHHGYTSRSHGFSHERQTLRTNRNGTSRPGKVLRSACGIRKRSWIKTSRSAGTRLEAKFTRSDPYILSDEYAVA